MPRKNNPLQLLLDFSKSCETSRMKEQNAVIASEPYTEKEVFSAQVLAFRKKSSDRVGKDKAKLYEKILSGIRHIG